MMLNNLLSTEPCGLASAQVTLYSKTEPRCRVWSHNRLRWLQRRTVNVASFTQEQTVTEDSSSELKPNGSIKHNYRQVIDPNSEAAIQLLPLNWPFASLTHVL